MFQDPPRPTLIPQPELVRFKNKTRTMNVFLSDKKWPIQCVAFKKIFRRVEWGYLQYLTEPV